jgi:hypothetical protein
MLFKLAPPGRHHPTIVLLTPGPHNETYFEHAYLARHLGFPLIEGADLTVRDRRVFLKTIEGLQPVDVILRRVDDSFCDPLELWGDSFLGVSGMVEATRAGNVTVANALGAGLLESPAFLAFLPNLCRHLLSEELLLPSIATWWCGQAEELRYVTEHLDSLILKPAFGLARPPSPPGSSAPKTRRPTADERAGSSKCCKRRRASSWPGAGETVASACLGGRSRPRGPWFAPTWPTGVIRSPSCPVADARFKGRMTSSSPCKAAAAAKYLGARNGTASG